jgi:hypothetical protein
MKYFSSVSIVAFTAFVLLSCTKSNDAAVATTATATPPVTAAPASINWKEKLKGTVWSGQYNYTAAAYNGLQPFSIELFDDGTLLWSDETSTRPGGIWKVQGDQVTFVFPNSTTLSANVSQDSMSHFSNPAINGFGIANLFPSVRPERSLITGNSYTTVINNQAVKITFLANGKVEIIKGARVFDADAYTIAGAGIQFNYTFTVSPLEKVYFYVLFGNNYAMLTGVEAHHVNAYAPKEYYNWTATKQ